MSSRAHEWQRVKGTSFLVDCFGKSTQLLKCKSWFLTHFHSDHYKGLRASFKQGGLFPSMPTLNMILVLGTYLDAAQASDGNGCLTLSSFGNFVMAVLRIHL